MKSAVTPHSIANAVRLSRSVHKHASAFLVEGFKDTRLLRNYINEDTCQLYPTHGKFNALGALSILRRSNHHGVLVALDSDFSQIGGASVTDPDVIFTDLHDIEAMMLNSPATRKVLIEYDLGVQEFGPDLGLLLATAVTPLGYLRVISIRDNLSLKFTELDFLQFLMIGSPPVIDEAKLIAEVLSKNPRCRVDAAGLQQKIDDSRDATHDPWHLGCGHDMTGVFAALLASKAGRPVPPFTVERQLRLAYEHQYFEASGFFARIRAWEQRNHPTRSLRKG